MDVPLGWKVLLEKMSEEAATTNNSDEAPALEAPAAATDSGPAEEAANSAEQVEGPNANNGQPAQTTQQGVALAPIHPYIPYYTAMIPAFPQPLPPANDDVFLTGATTNPYQYKDVSAMKDPVPDILRNRGGVLEPFPEKLHRMLEHTEHECKTDIVSFLSHGRAFAIHKPKKFQTEIMPRFFKQTRLTSFQRQ